MSLIKTLRNRLSGWRALALIVVTAFAATPWLLGPPCPNRLVIATGSKEGAYFAFANQYRDVLARHGITLEIRQTAGSLENQELLSDNEVSLGLIQGGATTNATDSGLESLASLYHEPVWVFCRSDSPVNGLGELRGKRISIGPDGSGTQAVALKLLSANRMLPTSESGSAAPTQIVKWKTMDSLKSLKAGDLDAAFIVISPDSPVVRDLLQTEGIQLVNFERAATYQRKYPFLSSVTVPEGLFSLQRNIPSRDIVLLAPAANLVARSDLHHALIPILLQTMEEVHEPGGLLTDSGQFPSAQFADYPVNSGARRYFRSGPGFFFQYLPFSIAATLDRIKLLLLPMCTLLIPLLKVAPPVYRWKIRSKIFRWYRVLREIEQKLKDAVPTTDFSADIASLQNLQSELAEVSVPLSYMAEFYSLHLHIEFVLRKLRHHGESNADGLRVAA